MVVWCQKVTSVWTVIVNTYEMFDCIRIISVQNQYSENRILAKIASAPDYPKMTLDAIRPKVPPICWTTDGESCILLRFALRSLVFPDNWVFGFSTYGTMVNLKFSKNNLWKSETPNFKMSQSRCYGKKILDKFQIVCLRL